MSIWSFPVVLCVIFMLSFLDLTPMGQKFKQELLQPCSSKHTVRGPVHQHHLGAYVKHRLSSHSPGTLRWNLSFNKIFSDSDAHQSLRCSALQALQQKQPDWFPKPPALWANTRLPRISVSTLIKSGPWGWDSQLFLEINIIRICRWS